MIFLTEFIGSDYKLWMETDEIFIQTPTGSGKTTFILQTLSKYASQKKKEVLLLVNRSILKKQIKRELLEEHGIKQIEDERMDQIRSFEGISVLSYQELQQELKRKEWPLGMLYEERFQYIVMDEIHYLLEDATFNREIPYMLKGIQKLQNATEIYLSATQEEVFPFLMRTLHPEEPQLAKAQLKEGKEIWGVQINRFVSGRVICYGQKAQFKIEKIGYFQKLNEIIEVVNADDSEEKWLIFVKSKCEAEKLKKGIVKDVAYLDADVEEEDEVKRQIIEEDRFKNKVLITTKVLDNGVNIRDRDLRNIVLLTTERTEFIQMLGRRRFVNENDTVRLFLACRDVRYFNAIRNRQLLPLIRFIDEVRRDDRFSQQRLDDEEFYGFCKRMTIIREGKIEVSQAAEEKIRLQMKFHDRLIEKFKTNPNAFVMEQLSWLGKEDEFCMEAYLGYGKNEARRGELFNYVEKMVGVKMNKEDQKKFREEFLKRAENCGKKLTDRAGKGVGKARINRFFKEEKWRFAIRSIGNSRYWMIQEVKLDDEEDICD